MNIMELSILASGGKFASKAISAKEFVRDTIRLASEDVTFGPNDPLYMIIEDQSSSLITQYSFNLRDLHEDVPLFSIQIYGPFYKIVAMPKTNIERVIDIIDTTDRVFEKYFKQESNKKMKLVDEAVDFDDDEFGDVEVLHPEYGWSAGEL